MRYQIAYSACSSMKPPYRCCVDILSMRITPHVGGFPFGASRFLTLMTISGARKNHISICLDNLSRGSLFKEFRFHLNL